MFCAQGGGRIWDPASRLGILGKASSRLWLREGLTEVGMGRPLGLRRLMDRTEVDLPHTGGKMGFQQVERRFKDKANEIGRLGRDRGERSRERKKQGKPGWPHGHSLDDEGWIQNFQNKPPWEPLLHGGSGPLRKGQPQLELCL